MQRSISGSTYLAGCLAAVLLLAGCASERQYPAPVMPAASLPHFAPGDAFSFDDGRTEKVMAVAGDRVTWSSGPNFRFVTSRNILLPRLEWESNVEQGERKLDVAPDTLWPLATGRSATLHYREHIADRAGGSGDDSIETLTCRVSGTAAVPTKAGAFDTYRVTCQRKSHSWLTAFAAERTFFYAPALGYYVRREDRYPGESRRAIELTDFQTAEPALPAGVDAMRRQTVQMALETKLSGEGLGWQAPNHVANGTVEPLRTFRDAAGRFCRLYAEQINSAGRIYRFNGEACRLADARWHPVEVP